MKYIPSHTLKRVIQPSVRHFDQHLFNRSIQLLWVHKIRRTKILSDRFFVRVEIDRDDLGGTLVKWLNVI